MPKISVIHPSRGRVELAYQCFLEWRGKAKNEDDIEYILSCDNDDISLPSYRLIEDMFFNNCKIVVHDNKNVVDAVNNGAKVTTSDILVCISDDFSCFYDWDEWILQNIDIEKPEALRINDTLQPTTIPIMTMPIITRKLYEKLGCIYDERFTGMYADNWLAEKCIAMGVYKVNNTKHFVHNHWATGRRKKDATNLRHDNPVGWTIGLETLRRERLNNFGLKKIIA